MFDSTNVLIASMRALKNELERVKSLSNHDEWAHLYQGDVSSGLSDLIELYIERSEADASLTPWRDLLQAFGDDLWPRQGS
jgi:hypothetical protein